MSEQEVLNLPYWQMDLVRERKEGNKYNPDQAMDFDIAMDEIEAGL